MGESGRPGRGGEFFTLLDELCVFRAGPLAGDPSDRALARSAGVSPTTIGDWLRGERFPQDIGKVLVMVRTVRVAAVRRGVAIPGSVPLHLLDEDRWRAVYQQEAQRRAGVVSVGAERAQAVWALAGPRVRVRETDLRLLGVHAAISVPGVPDEVPPEYVPRDVDAHKFGVRAKVAATAQRGGFVLLVGGSSVGKTRSAAETVKALLPDWWLMHPAGPAEVAAVAQAPPPRTVVWLDEMQRYLDGERGLTGAVMRALLNAPDLVVIIGTLWPDWYAAYTKLPDPVGPDPHAREREVLDLADVVRIGPEFSPAEQGRARAAAARDPRLRAALESAEYGLTQTLAAAPQLVGRWKDAQTASPYGWAVLTAALDVARLGGRAPLSADLLRAAAPGYCTPQQRAEAQSNWFEQAMAYATAKLPGAVAALAPAGTAMGHLAGYTIMDYLIQHASRERRYVRVPASTWDALISHVRDPADSARLADSAMGRLLYCVAMPLYRHAADAGDRFAAWRLAQLLPGHRNPDGIEPLLHPLADEVEPMASGLEVLRATLADPDKLRAQADAGDEYAAWQLAEQLAWRGDLDGLRARADAGDESAASRLAEQLDQRGDLDGLRARADAGDESAASRLAEQLDQRGDLDEAVQILRARSDAAHGYAGSQLADLLTKLGDLDGAVQILRARAEAGHGDAWSLAKLLAQQGRDREAKQLRQFGLTPDGAIAAADEGCHS